MLGKFLAKGLVVVVLLAHVVQGKVDCYVCSWHNPTFYHESTNISDSCSHYHFDPMFSVTFECENGCEAVGIRNGRNGDIINFYKNCIPQSKAVTNVEEKCTTTEEDMKFITTCECTSYLCNVAINTKLYLGDINGFTFYVKGTFIFSILTLLLQLLN